MTEPEWDTQWKDEKGQWMNLPYQDARADRPACSCSDRETNQCGCDICAGLLPAFSGL